MMRHSLGWICLLTGCILLGCKNSRTDQPLSPNSSPSLFTLLPGEQTGIDFQNRLTETLNTNILMYEYFYNGGGVATGDLNGDGLEDIYFTSNMADNKLYLNEGHMKFKDITSESGAMGRMGPWKTGITMVDVNGDHKLDLYLSYSGTMRQENRVNQLFINIGNDAKGVPHFIEKASAYGLANAGYHNQSYFFDYDRDGDLDVLLLNHNPKSLPILNEASTEALFKTDDPQKGVRLLKQDNGHFEDVTQQVGINGSALSYGLGAGIADVNKDGWPDIYVSNDYNVPDYLYINNQNGTFSNQIQQRLNHTSHFSMGNDIADINNDGQQDIVTLDMLPEDNHRQKLLLAPDNYNKFNLNVRSGFYYQYMRNMLQLNNGNGTFSEVGQLAGISNTDWSWSALLADYDNDGWKDLLVTNGYYRDYTNLDFIKYMDDYVKRKGRLMREDILKIIEHIPASNVTNYIFSIHDSLKVLNETKAWGMNRPSNSNGAAYSDLDNDGDLDLVINNINQPAFVFQNESNKNSCHFLQLKLQGEGQNTQGLGATVVISVNERKQYIEQMNARGYLSSVSPILQFGLGKENQVDSLTITWPSGKQELLTKLKSNQRITLSERNATIKKSNCSISSPLFTEVVPPIHYESPPLEINDFYRQTLLISQPSYAAACMIKADVNKDGLEDVYVGGGNGQSAQLFIQQRNGNFILKSVPAFEEDKWSEDADAIFFDANGDGHPDIYVASGGYHQYSANDPLLQDRLYINDGHENFTKNKKALPDMRVSKGCVAAYDINQDGFPDLFVGGKIVPGRYPETPSCFLLINDGKGNFTNQIKVLAPELEKLGMISDAAWVDLNQDNKLELVVVGEWIPVSVFELNNRVLANRTAQFFDKEYSGWWNTITTGDFNNDGRQDLIIGNMGLNTQFHVSEKEPAEMYFKDFDNNGSIDPFFCFYVQGKSFPYVTRDEMLEQIGSLRKRYVTYESYADITLADCFKKEDIKRAGHLQANHMATTYFQCNANGKLTPSPLPIQAQYSPVNAITVLDYNQDGNADLLLCGNNSKTKLRLGRFDANFGVLLKGNGRGRFEYVNQANSGFKLKGDIKSVIELNKKLLFFNSQKQIVAYELVKRKK